MEIPPHPQLFRQLLRHPDCTRPGLESVADLTPWSCTWNEFHDGTCGPLPAWSIADGRFLHLIVSIPVFRVGRTVRVPVEIQIRTIAMDFWASLEHKIYYKYRGEVPPNLQSELTQAAEAANRLDEKMESLHRLVDHNGESRTVSEQSESLDFTALYENLLTER